MLIGVGVVPHDASISYSGIGSLELNTAAVINTVDVEGTAVPTTVNAGGGNLIIDVSSQAENLDNIAGPLTVNGNSADPLVVNDQQATPDETYTVTANTVSRSGIAPITYAGIGHLVFYAGTGNNLLYVESTAAGTTTDVYGGAGASTDEFQVAGAPLQLDDIQGPLNLHGQNGPGTGISGQTYVELNDASTVAVQSYTVTAGTLNRSGIAPITYDHQAYEALYTSERASAVVNVQSEALDDATVIALDRLDDQVNFGSTAPALGGTLADIQGTVAVEGNPSSVVVDDSGDTTDHPHEVLSSSTAPYDYEINGLASGTLDFSMDPATPVTILNGSGNDDITVTTPISTSGITINGGGGTNSLTFDDRQTTVDESYTVTASGVGSKRSGTISYANMANLVLYAGTGNDILVVASTAAGTTTDVYGGASSNVDDFEVSNAAERLDDIQGPLNLHGQNGPGTGFGGESYVVLGDGGTAAQTYTLTAGTVNRTGIAPIAYDHLVVDVLYTSAVASAVVNVQSNATNVLTQIALLGSGDQVAFGSLAPGLGGTLANIQGSVGVSGDLSASIVVDDSGDVTAHPRAVISNSSGPYDYQLSGLAPGALLFSLDPATPISILGGSGNDTFTAASSLSATGIRIDGGSGTNTLAGPSTTNTWAITGQNSGSLNTVAFSNFQNLVGSSVGDAFQFSDGKGVTGTINGGTGTTSLDYSHYSTRVNVDLGDGTNGTATGVGGTVTGITALIGGSSNDKLNAGNVPNVATDRRVGHQQPERHWLGRQRRGIDRVELYADQHQVDRDERRLHRQSQRHHGRVIDRCQCHQQ